MNSINIEEARKIGATCGTAVESERLAFEAWIDGHCWPLGAKWDGRGYSSSRETEGYIDIQAMNTRIMWAAWRDRAELANGNNK